MKQSISVRTPFPFTPVNKPTIPELCTTYDLTFAHIDTYDNAYFLIDEIDYDIISDKLNEMKFDNIPLHKYNDRLYLKIKHTLKSFRVRNRLMNLQAQFYHWIINDKNICTCEIRE